MKVSVTTAIVAYTGARMRSPYAVALNSQSASLALLATNVDFLNPTQKRDPFALSDSGSSRMRFTADLASHSRAFCRNSAAVCTPSFSFMRIWCVSIVLMLTFNSFANSDELRPLPIKEKISSSRLVRLLMSELPTFLAPHAKVLRIIVNTLAPTYGRPVEISSNALSVQERLQYSNILVHLPEMRVEPKTHQPARKEQVSLPQD